MTQPRTKVHGFGSVFLKKHKLQDARSGNFPKKGVYPFK